MAASVTPLEASVEATLSTLRAQLPHWRDQPFTIFRVPAYVRESNPTAYKPRMVSIGPYYHRDVALRAMEDHKWRYLDDLLSRKRNTAVSSSLLIQEMRSLESRARACYSERPAALDSDDFVRMLLLDASFILEFFFKWHYKMADPLCDVCWGRTLITSDLLLLENQIPFFVVEKIYDVIAGGSRENLFNLLLEYMYTGIEDDAIPSATSEIHHLLHLLYESVVPKPNRSPGSSEGRVILIPRAAEMRAAGVTFVPRSSDRVMDHYDVTFDASRGVMAIPVVEVDDMKRPLLINLIAFEQSQGGEETRVVTSYVNLMTMIVRTAEDVALLRRRGILVNLLADDEARGAILQPPRGRQCHELQVPGLLQAVRRHRPILQLVVAQEHGGAQARLLRQPVVRHFLRRRWHRPRPHRYADVLHSVSLEVIVFGFLSKKKKTK